MNNVEFLNLRAGDVVRELGELFTVISLNMDNTDTLKRHRDGKCGNVPDERLKRMELVVSMAE